MLKRIRIACRCSGIQKPGSLWWSWNGILCIIRILWASTYSKPSDIFWHCKNEHIFIPPHRFCDIPLWNFNSWGLKQSDSLGAEIFITPGSFGLKAIFKLSECETSFGAGEGRNGIYDELCTLISSAHVTSTQWFLVESQCHSGGAVSWAQGYERYGFRSLLCCESSRGDGRSLTCCHSDLSHMGFVGCNGGERYVTLNSLKEGWL